MFVNVKNMGGHYAGENYGSADIALQYGGPGGSWSNWNADDKPHLQKNAEKYRKQNHRREKHPRNRQQPADQPEGKMAEALENTGQASSQNESAGVVSGTFVHCDPWYQLTDHTRIRQHHETICACDAPYDFIFK